MMLTGLNKPQKKFNILHEFIESNNWVWNKQGGLEKISKTSDRVGDNYLGTQEVPVANFKIHRIFLHT